VSNQHKLRNANLFPNIDAGKTIPAKKVKDLGREEIMDVLHGKDEQQKIHTTSTFPVLIILSI